MLRVAKTENGKVQGLPGSDPRITSFKGIPFAAPPVGENRWRAPQPCENWEGIRQAFDFGPIAIQDTPGLGTDIYCREWHVDPDIPMSEDCLYLNVWTPAHNANEKLPVLFWIYGGAFQWGYASEMELDGERLARRGVVVVSCTYRLGALGYLAHPELTKSQPDAPTNFGSLDQQAALKWTVRNIAAFGGDPDNISIGGQSAGGASAMLQMTCEDNYADIKSGMIISGIIRMPYFYDEFFIPGKLSRAEQNGAEFLDFCGVSGIEEARKLDAIYIRDMYAKYRENHLFMSPCIDGKFCVDEPLNRLANNQCADIPLIVGNTTDEFISAIEASNEEEYERCVKENFGDRASEFMEIAQGMYDPQLGYAPVSALEPAIRAMIYNREKAGNKKPIYYYCFDADIPGEDNPGTFHSVDLWFFFETLAKCSRPYSGHHYELAATMCDYWCNFIKTGDPNGRSTMKGELPKWEPHTEENPMIMKFEKDTIACKLDKSESLVEFLVDNTMNNFKKGGEKYEKAGI